MGNTSQGAQQLSMQQFQQEQRMIQERFQREQQELQKNLDIERQFPVHNNGGGSNPPNNRGGGNGGNPSNPNDWTRATEISYGSINGTPIACYTSAGDKGYLSGEGTYEIIKSGRTSVAYESSKTTFHVKKNNYHHHGSHWDGSNGKQDGHVNAGRNPFHGTLKDIIK